jgi:hypothetical protein
MVGNTRFIKDGQKPTNGMIMEVKTNGEMNVTTIDADRGTRRGHVALHDPALRMKAIGYEYGSYKVWWND